jgi:hypothetical protein
MWGVKYVALVGLLAILLVTSSYAQSDFDLLLIDSQDGMDVYSGIVYAELEGKPFNFLVSTQHAVRAVKTIDKAKVKKIFLIESRNNSYYYGYKSLLESQGFQVEELISEYGVKTNLELAKKTDAKNFIVVDTSYGYNALSVSPYASLTNAFVLLLDAGNAEEARDFLSLRGVDNLLIYGYVQPEVKEALKEFSPKVLDKEDKFDNNIEIAKRYIDEYQKKTGTTVKQVFLTDGTFLQTSLMEGSFPIIFISERVPDQVYEYLSKSNIRVGVVVGNHLATAGYTIKTVMADRYGVTFGVLLQFGQSVPDITGPTVRYLDIFELPSYVLDVGISDARYNKATKKLEVIYQNNVDLPAYLKSTIEVMVNGRRIKTVGEKDVVLIGKNELLGREYDVDLSEVDVLSANVTAKITLLFGEYPKSMEKGLVQEFLIAIIDRQDPSGIAFVSLYYDEQKDQLSLTVKNTGLGDVFFKINFRLNINGSQRVFESGAVDYLAFSESKSIGFGGVDLSEEDLKTNEFVRVHAVYGEREEFLVKELEKELKLQMAERAGAPLVIPPELYLLLIAGLVALLLFFLYKSMKPLKLLLLQYSPQLSQFSLTVKNKSKGRIFVRPLVKYVRVDGGETIVLGRDSEPDELEPKETRAINIRAKLGEADLKANYKVEVSLLFGPTSVHLNEDLTKRPVLKIREAEINEQNIEDSSKDELIHLCAHLELSTAGSSRELRQRLRRALKIEELTEEMIEDSSKKDLTRLCKERGLLTRGISVELRSRLKDYIRTRALGELKEALEAMPEVERKEERELEKPVEIIEERKPLDVKRERRKRELEDVFEETKGVGREPEKEAFEEVKKKEPKKFFYRILPKKARKHVKLTEHDIEHASREQLEKYCRLRGLPAEGNIDVLRELLLEFEESK